MMNKLRVGKVYEIIQELKYFLYDEHPNDLVSQNDEDPGMFTIEFYEYAKQKSWISGEVIVIPTGTKIIKIENLGPDKIDHYERFVIDETDVQVALTSEFATDKEFLMEAM